LGVADYAAFEHRSLGTRAIATKKERKKREKERELLRKRDTRRIIL